MTHRIGAGARSPDVVSTHFPKDAHIGTRIIKKEDTRRIFAQISDLETRSRSSDI